MIPPEGVVMIKALLYTILTLLLLAITVVVSPLLPFP